MFIQVLGLFFSLLVWFAAFSMVLPFIAPIIIVVLPIYILMQAYNTTVCRIKNL